MGKKYNFTITEDSISYSSFRIGTNAHRRRNVPAQCVRPPPANHPCYKDKHYRLSRENREEKTELITSN